MAFFTLWPSAFPMLLLLLKLLAYSLSNKLTVAEMDIFPLQYVLRQVYVSAHSTKMPPAFALLLRAMRNYGDIRQATNINQ